LFKSLSIWKWLKLETPRAFTNPSSTSSSMTCHWKEYLLCSPERTTGTPAWLSLL
jgi:hypothetical protein